MRKETIIAIDDAGTPLEFKIKQMPATRLYDFSIRALLLLAGTGAKTGEGGGVEALGQYIENHGFDLFSKIDHEKAKPLLEELLGCCTRLIRSPGGGSPTEQLCSLAVLDGFIQDFRTIFKLQFEALKVNYDFFGQGAESPSNSPEVIVMGKPHRTGA